MPAPYKVPVSVLVVIHTPDLQVLLLERADRPGFWQSVTGSQDAGETLAADAGGTLRDGDCGCDEHWRHRVKLSGGRMALRLGLSDMLLLY